MSTRTLLALAVALLCVHAAAAAPDSWLQGGTPPEPESPPRSDLFGLRAADQAVRPYHHPFSPVAGELADAARAHQAEPGRVYLLRSDPGPANFRANRRFNGTHRRRVAALGFTWLGTPVRGGTAFTPLMGIARFDGEEPVHVPGWLRAVPVDTAQVRLCLLGLDPAGGPSWETPLHVSEALAPETALRRARGIIRFAGSTWGDEKLGISREELARNWPDAMTALTGKRVEDAGILLALRVLWRSGTREIPGPGGTLIKARDRMQAHRRLIRLYERPAP